MKYLYPILFWATMVAILLCQQSKAGLRADDVDGIHGVRIKGTSDPVLVWYMPWGWN